MTTKEVASFLGFDPQTIRVWAASHKHLFPQAKRRGHAFEFDELQIRRWLFKYQHPYRHKGWKIKPWFEE